MVLIFLMFTNEKLLLAVDCRWSSFGNWSTCSKTCGKGYKTSKRYQMNNATHGGKECEGKRVKTAQCNLTICPGIRQQKLQKMILKRISWLQFFCKIR